jgi:hypothetical protein
MLATIKWNSRYNAREWMMMAGALVVQLSALNALRRKGESKPRPPRHSGNTSTTPIIGTQSRRNGSPTMIGDRATHYGFRRPNSETTRSLSLTGPSSGAAAYR